MIEHPDWYEMGCSIKKPKTTILGQSIDIWMGKEDKGSMLDGFAKKHNRRFFVIPAKAGILEFQKVINRLDTRFRGYDDFLRVHQWLKDLRV